MLILISFFTFFFILGSSEAFPNMRIVNGSDAELGSAKFQVWVRQMHSETNYRMCGGILLGPNKVLTAAHCLIHGDGEVAVRYGTLDLKKVYKPDVFASKFVVHPMWYPSNHDYDIAIITLQQNILQDAHVRYAELETSEILPYGSRVDIYGWGYTSGNNRTVPVHMQHTKLQTEFCSWSSRTICARSHTSIACQGDSGGSMITSDGKAVGILSAVSKGCVIGGVNIYTKIASHSFFIKQNM